MHCGAVTPLHKPMRCAAFPIRARCGLWPSVHPSTRAPAIHFVAPGVTQRLNPGIPGLTQKALLHSSELLVHSQMLTVALLAMFTGVANPEILRMVSIESSGARLGHPRGMCVEARMTLALSPGSAKTERSPVEHRVGYTTRITSSHLRIGGDLPLAACRRCHNLSLVATTLAHLASATLLESPGCLALYL